MTSANADLIAAIRAKLNIKTRICTTLKTRTEDGQRGRCSLIQPNNTDEVLNTHLDRLVSTSGNDAVEAMAQFLTQTSCAKHKTETSTADNHWFCSRFVPVWLDVQECVEDHWAVVSGFNYLGRGVFGSIEVTHSQQNNGQPAGPRPAASDATCSSNDGSSSKMLDKAKSYINRLVLLYSFSEEVLDFTNATSPSTAQELGCLRQTNEAGQQPGLESFDSATTASPSSQHPLIDSRHMSGNGQQAATESSSSDLSADLWLNSNGYHPAPQSDFSKNSSRNSSLHENDHQPATELGFSNNSWPSEDAHQPPSDSDTISPSQIETLVHWNKEFDISQSTATTTTMITTIPQTRITRPSTPSTRMRPSLHVEAKDPISNLLPGALIINPGERSSSAPGKRKRSDDDVDGAGLERDPLSYSISRSTTTSTSSKISKLSFSSVGLEGRDGWMK